VRRILKLIAQYLLIFVLTIFLLEGSLRGINKLVPGLLFKPPLKLKLDYADTRRKESMGLGPGGYLQENFDALVNDAYGGAVHWKNNAQGFRNNYDVAPQPPKGVIRIMSLGDSFTAGYRLGQDETFSSRLERFFNGKADGNTYEVLVSCIEEPATGLYYLNQYGTSFNPHFVLLGITLGNDIAQVYISLDPLGTYILDDSTAEIIPKASRPLGFKHGLENKLIPGSCIDEKKKPRRSLLSRFVTFRLLKTVFNKRHSGESISSWYGDKEKPRLFDPCNALGQYLKEPPQEILDSYERLFRVINAFKTVAVKNHFGFAAVIFPQRFQVQREDWECTVSDYRLNKACFDLTKPNKLLTNFCAQNGILCIDPTAALAAAYAEKQESLFCPRGDMHLNAQGNRILFEAIKDTLYRATR